MLSLEQHHDAILDIVNKDDWLKRLAAKDIVDFIIRHKESEDLDRHLTEIEKLLAERPK